MKFIRLAISSIFIFIMFNHCVKTDYNFENYHSEIVIDGWIEQDKFCQVLLTLSVPYFSDIDSLSLRKYALTKARVTLSDGEKSEILTLKPNDAYFPPYLYISTEIKGEVGKTYTLTVDYQGTQATATTTIPEPLPLDSIWYKPEEGKDSVGYIWIRFTDPVNQKNYYRTLTRRKNVDSKYIPTYLSNFNDDYFNGKSFDIALYRGNTSSLEKNDDFYYHKGDTIQVKFCAVDFASYEFWLTFQKEIMNTGNPFASSNARVKSNVSNGLGIWCGYGSTYYQVIAK